MSFAALLRVGALACALALASLGCAGSQAYVDWRPGLRAMDFDGAFEIPLDEYEALADEGEPNTLFDRYRGESKPEASAAMGEVGARLAEGVVDPRGYSMLRLGGDGQLGLRGAGDRELSGAVEWFAATPSREFVAALSGTKLAVAIGPASAGVDLDSLLEAGAGGYAYMMVIVDGAELSVFALPAIGGVVNANEPGYLLSFRHQAGAREPWDITVARVAIRM